MARNCQFPTVGTHGCQHGPQVPIAKNFRVLNWSSWLPTWEPQGAIAKSCVFLEIRTYVFDARPLPSEGTAGSQSLKVMVPNLKKHNFLVEGSLDAQKFELMVLNVVLFIYSAGNKTVCFA